MNSRGWWLSSNSICLLSILHEFAWTMATLKQYFFIIYSPRIHMDDSYPRTASFYYLFSTNSCGRWLLSNNIFLLSILHEFMWSSRTASFYYLFSMNSCGRWLLSNSIFLSSSILHEFMWTVALEQHLFIIYSLRIHVDDGYSQIASFYHLFSMNSCGWWLLSNSIFLSSILHEFMWTMVTLEQYLFIISVNSWMMAFRGLWRRCSDLHPERNSPRNPRNRAFER